jgi:signal transduction histidine kinase/HAMP domain-containing protein
VVLFVVTALLLVLARPDGRGRWPWIAVLFALVGALAPEGRAPDVDRLSGDLDDHCRGMLSAAQRIAGDESLNRLFAATGEALDPTRPFALLDDAARREDNRTIFLADDRGRLIAWGGAERGYPTMLRPLGPRAWGVEWSAARGVLHLREPLMIEGRIVGSVTVADGVGLRGPRVWGMRAPPGRELVLSRSAPAATKVVPEIAPGVTVEVGSAAVDPWGRRGLFALAWLMLVVGALIEAPRMAWAAVLIGVAVAAQDPGGLSTAERMILLLCIGAALGRGGRELSPRWARLVLIFGLAGAAAIRLSSLSQDLGWWLPDHLLRPGWGGVWMVALAWAVSGWPGLARGGLPLAKRMALAAGLALLGLAVDIVWFPAQILRLEAGDESRVVLPRRTVAVDDVLPAEPTACRLDDLAPVLASHWGLPRWRTPSRLSLVDRDGLEVSSWGDLSPAGDRQRLARVWPLSPDEGARLELDVASEPWAWLEDWNSGEPLEDARRRLLWFAVLTRSGSVAATLHPEIGDLDPAVAGDAYHAGALWTRIALGDGRALARVVRRGDWLVAAVAHPPAWSVWVVRTALAMLWALFGLILARPPGIKREQFSTFGGRLRLLVAAGVVIPLVILTLFLQLRLGREEARLEEVLGLEALDAARYTIEHLGGGAVVDDNLASWLAQGWGGEVVFFDGSIAVAASRIDLLSTGRIPQLPLLEAFPAYLLGRADAVVARRPGWVVSAGTVTVEGQRFLLQLYRTDPLGTGSAPDAVDWLLTGAFLAALLALTATGRIEERLSVSLRDLVDLAARLARGEPVGPVRQPRETDLAEVLNAVRSMNEEVRRRELSLRHQEELLRITLANLAPAVMVFEPDGDLRFANPSAENLLDEYGDLVHDRVRELAGEIEGETSPTATRQPIPGRDLTWRIGVARVPLPDGRNGLVGVIDDVTEVVRVDRLQQLNQLARIVAHEVKNPLTPVRLWVQELDEARRRDEPNLDALLGEACREIAVQVERLHNTATSFSNLVALEHWEAETVDLAAAASVSLEGFGVLKRRGINLAADLPDTGRALVTADRQWLRRALANLVQNSIDALGEDPGEIRLRVTVEGDRVVFEIEDSGGGVAPDQLPELFSPHFSTTAAGSGLGLALVHQVVVRCQGEVEAANGPAGLRIRVFFPSVTMTT